MDKILRDRKIEKGIIVPIGLEFDDGESAIRVTEDYIDIGYSSKETPARVLSNLYPYKFDYFGNKINSIEAAIQSLKYRDESVRKICYEYSGVDAVHLRGMIPYDWQKEGILYTPSKAIDRFSDEYQIFLDELYCSAFQNPLYRSNLEHTGNKKLDHSIGENDVKYTTLTRTEYISRLYGLRYCAKNKLLKKEEVMNVLKQVIQELNIENNKDEWII